MIIIISLSIGLALIFIIVWIIGWSVHITMNNSTSYDAIGWGNFHQFVSQFNKYNKWKYDSQFNSFFGEGQEWDSYKIHADIIKFNNCCMNLYPIDYLRYHIWLHNQKKKYCPMIKW
jgi:hypothetical protein